MSGATQIIEDNGAMTYVPFVIINDDQIFRIQLLIKGAMCAACIQKIESAVSRDPRVQHVRLNFTTGLLSIEWKGDKSAVDEFACDIKNLGYGVSYVRALGKNNDDQSFLLRCLGVSAFAMGNIMLVSIALWSYSSIEMGETVRSFLELAVATIALPAIAYAGQPFFHSAYSVLKTGHTNMDVPISLGVILACIISVIGMFQHQEHLYFDSAVMLVFFLLLGRYFDACVRAKATSAASELLQMMVQVAQIETENGTREYIDVRNIRPGMIMHVAVGERIAADSEVVEGSSEIDMSLVTGETIPTFVQIGSGLYAGTLNIQSPLRVRVSKPASDSLLADIVRLVEKAESAQAFYTRIADRAAKLYTPFVHAMALITFVGWYAAGLPFMECLMRATTVLIITCPCALGLAVPVVQVLAISRLMKMGILVKDGTALEKLSKIDTIIFDKTGTLTHGHPTLINRSDISDQDMQLAASIAAQSRHPLSKSIVAAWGGDINTIKATEISGSGLETGDGVRLGRAEWCGVETQSRQTDFMELYLSIPRENRHVRFLFRDELKEDAVQTIQTLKHKSLNPMILSGDREAVVRDTARTLSIDSYQSDCRPENKVHFIEDIKAKGCHVLMVGDGLNDTPVLSAASIAMSPSSAIDMAQNAASIIFSGQKLHPIIEAIDMAIDSQRKIKQNFALAIIYNIFAVPLAVMGYVTPLVAAIAMSSSSLIVIGNSFRLRRGKGQ